MGRQQAGSRTGDGSASTATGAKAPVLGVGMVLVEVSVHRFHLDSQLVCGQVDMAIRPQLPIQGVDIILGNDLAGAKIWEDGPPLTYESSVLQGPTDPAGSVEEQSTVFSSSVVTRAQSNALLEQSQCSQVGPTEGNDLCNFFPVLLPEVSREEWIKEQNADATLRPLFELGGSESELRNALGGYFLSDGLLLRKWVRVVMGAQVDSVVQVVVPLKFRDLVLSTSHDGVGGHLGVKKTYDKVLRHFFWPSLKKDVAAYSKTCRTCQLTGKPNQKIKPAPLYPIPVVEEPFEYLLLDCVGLLTRSRAGNQYLLTVMCKSTRYPAAFPLRSIKTKPVLKSLTSFISTFGVPKAVQTDQGSNFMSRTFSQVLKQLKVEHCISSAYHPESQGVLERFHQTLKSMLRSYCTELSHDWEEGLPWLLLAIREVSQSSTGFSPNELVFGHAVRGPLAVLGADLKPREPPDNVLDYVNGFLKSLGGAQGKMKEVF